MEVWYDLTKTSNVRTKFHHDMVAVTIAPKVGSTQFKIFYTTFKYKNLEKVCDI